MTRQVFFSFHYEADVWRASQVRYSWVTKDRESAGFWDKAEWEQVQRRGKPAVETWIDNQLKGTSVTVVLIGSETAERPYVGYEIQQSYAKGNGLLGIYIHSMKDSNGKTCRKGRNPFDNWRAEIGGKAVLLSSLYKTYNWVDDDGRSKMAGWIEAAAKAAGR